MKKTDYIIFIGIFFALPFTSWAASKSKSRLLEEKELFDKIIYLEKMKFSNTSFKVATNFFGAYTKIIESDSGHGKAICFKSSSKLDKSIIILLKSSLSYNLHGFELFRNGSNYKYFSKCNAGKKVIRNLKISDGLLSLNMDRKKINNMLGMDDYSNKGIWSELNYFRNYNEYKPLPADLTYTIEIKFDKNDKAERIYITRLLVY